MFNSVFCAIFFCKIHKKKKEHVAIIVRTRISGSTSFVVYIRKPTTEMEQKYWIEISWQTIPIKCFGRQCIYKRHLKQGRIRYSSIIRTPRTNLACSPKVAFSLHIPPLFFSKNRERVRVTKVLKISSSTTSQPTLFLYKLNNSIELH